MTDSLLPVSGDVCAGIPAPSPSPPASSRPVLTLLQTRVLGALVEKELTVADTYPLTLNALTAACNQKSSRDPVLNASESEVQEAIDGLKRLTLVIESSGGRTMRYAQNIKRVLNLPGASVALLATLMLRGPQTAGEIRLNADRLHRFSDISAVEAFLDELAHRSQGPLVTSLARQPGTREIRWVHLLSGPADQAFAAQITAARLSSAATQSSGEDAVDQQAQIAELQEEIVRLKAALTRVCDALGLEAP